MSSRFTFWKVSVWTGFSGGLLVFLALHLVILFTKSFFSVFYIFIYLLPLVVMIFASIRHRSINANRRISFGQACLLNLITGVLALIISSITIYLVYTYINPSALEARIYIVEAELQNTLSTGSSSLDQNKLHALMSPYNLAIYYGFVNLILISIFAIIIAIFAKRNSINPKHIEWFD